MSVAGTGDANLAVRVLRLFGGMVEQSPGLATKSLRRRLACEFRRRPAAKTVRIAGRDALLTRRRDACAILSLVCIVLAAFGRSPGLVPRKSRNLLELWHLPTNHRFFAVFRGALFWP